MGIRAAHVWHNKGKQNPNFAPFSLTLLPLFVPPTWVQRKREIKHSHTHSRALKFINWKRRNCFLPFFHSRIILLIVKLWIISVSTQITLLSTSCVKHQRGVVFWAVPTSFIRIRRRGFGDLEQRSFGKTLRSNSAKQLGRLFSPSYYLFVLI